MERLFQPQAANICVPTSSTTDLCGGGMLGCDARSTPVSAIDELKKRSMIIHPALGPRVVQIRLLPEATLQM